MKTMMDESLTYVSKRRSLRRTMFQEFSEDGIDVACGVGLHRDLPQRNS
jgi:hypothetical protein